MYKIYEKDIIYNKKGLHGIHVNPKNSDLHKIINLEGPQRILVSQDESNSFIAYANANENTHQDIYVTLCDNEYLSKENSVNFGFLVETKQFFGGSIILNKDMTSIDEPGYILFCKYFNLLVINGYYKTIEQACYFYELLPKSLRSVLGELSIEECMKKHKIKTKGSDLQTFLKNKPEDNKIITSLLKYINDMKEILEKDTITNNDIKQLKLQVKLAINSYYSYKKNP